MSKVTKYIIVVLTTTILVGCSYTFQNTQSDARTAQQYQQSFSVFNDENYIWEDWSFGTNKVNNLYK